LETTLGTIVIEFHPDAAPKHVEAFRKRVRGGFYVHTTFHRAIPMGIIQGGDPLTRDRGQFTLYGTGGLFELKSEVSSLSHVRGAVSAVLVPGNPSSAGSQFFICVTDQKQLDGQYTLFGQVVEGMDVVEKISMLPVDDQQRITERVEILKTFERDSPAPEALPFVTASVDEMKAQHAIIETALGEIELEFFPEVAPEHVRRFLQYSKLGLYDETRFHRVVPDFVIQGGSLSTRSMPIPDRYSALLRPLRGEFNDHPHVRGTLSMARTDDPDSAVDSFFICLAPAPSLDRQYTVFGQVVRGIDAVDGISQLPVRGETPVVPFLIQSIRIVEKADFQRH